MADELSIKEEEELKKKILWVDTDQKSTAKMKTAYGLSLNMTEEETDLRRKIFADTIETYKVDANSHHVLPRQFRWTLEPKTNPGLKLWFRSVEHDMVSHTLKISSYETSKSEIDQWLNAFLPGKQISDDILTLTTYDGNGNELYSFLFCDLRLRKHKSSYDYTNSDVVIHKFLIEYSRYGKKIFKE